MLNLNLEGIVAKKKYSEYTEADRSNEWLITPIRKRQEFVIGGWAESDKERAFKSLLFGAYENGKFNWIGSSGGGLCTQMLTIEYSLHSFRTLFSEHRPFFAMNLVPFKHRTIRSENYPNNFICV